MLVPLLVGLIVSTASAQSEPFLDVVGHPQAEQIETLHLKGIVQGYGYGIFRPDIPVNRAEYLQMLILAVHGETPVSGTLECFTDFRGRAEWYQPAACAAKESEVIGGYPDGTFRGGQTVNLAEALAMAVRAWQIQLPQYIRAPDHWYDPFFVAVSDRGIAEYFRSDPGYPLTRGDAAWILVSLGQPIAMVEVPGSSSSVSSVSSVSSSSVSSTSSASVHSVCGNGIEEGIEQCDDGNREDGDGCSSLCIIVPEPIQHAAIRLDQKTLGSQTLTGGTSQTVLFSFDASARWQDAILTGLKFRAVTGDLTSAFNYRLYQDEDGDGRPDRLVGSGLVREGVLTFSDLPPIVHVSHTTRMEVRADLSLTTGSSVALGFLTSDPLYVQAVGRVDGRELLGIRTDGQRCAQTYSNCWIAVYTEEPSNVTVSERGSLFVTKSAQPVRSRQVLTGMTSDDLLRLSFYATDEDIEVRRIAVAGAAGSIASLELFEPGSLTPLATLTTVQCHAPMSGLYCAVLDWVVPKDQTRDLLVRAVLRPVSEGARSGEAFVLNLSASTIVTDPAVEALGIASQSDLLQNDGDATAEGEIVLGRTTPGANAAITGSTHDVVQAKLIQIADGSTYSDGTALLTGVRTLGTFRFVAAPATETTSRSLTLTRLTFSVTATNALFGTGSFILVNSLLPNLSAPCTETKLTGVFRVVCSSLDASNIVTSISAGADATFRLKGRIEEMPATPSLLEVSLGDLNDRSTAGSVEWTDGATAFRWVDISDTDVSSTLYQTP